MPNFTETQKQDIIHQYSIEKKSSKVIAKQYKCSDVTILNYLTKWGIPRNSRKLDLTGQRFGQLTAIEPAKNRDDKYSRWVCKCDCGNIIEVRTDYLRMGHTTSCGCKAGRVDHTGQRFGRLVAIEHLAGGKYLCKCDCGNIVEVFTDNLMNGTTQSCGCYQKDRTSEVNLKDLIGQRYGKLTVIERAPNNQFNHVCWKCKCDCGGEIIVEGTRLKNGTTTSCGCIKSKGESAINLLLQENNIKFQVQYSVDSIILESNRHPFFDFAVFDDNNNLKYLIEYDGKQHFEYSGYGWDNKENFEKTQFRDNQKNKQCKDNNIPLIRIPYTHLNDLKIEDLLLETSEYIVK